MDSEVRPYDDEAGSGPWPGTGPGTRESGWPVEGAGAGRTYDPHQVFQFPQGITPA
jgi:hypothetical protein